MANIIKIKRSTGATAPGSLGAGELAFTGGAGTASNNGQRLFIGDPANSSAVTVIGGNYYTGLFSTGANGAVVADKVVTVDSNSKVDIWNVDNLRLNGNTVSSQSGALTISSAAGLQVIHTGSIDMDGQTNEILIQDNQSASLAIKEGSNSYLTFVTTNGSEKITVSKQLDIAGEYTLPVTDGTNGQALITNGSGAVSFATVSSSLTVGADSGSDDAVSLLSDTLNFTGGEGIDTTVSNNTITIAAEDATAGNKGIASFDSTDFSVSSGAVSVNATTLGSSALNPGATTSSIAGLTSLTSGVVNVDNLTLDGNEISTTNANGALSLNPNGSGTVNVNTSRIINVTDPTGAQDAATKAYVDAVKQALDIKDSVRVATTANITISSDLNVGDTIDGVTLANGDRVLVKDQSTGSQNGIYTAGAVPARAADANTDAEVTAGMFVFVEEGTANADNGYVLTTNDTISLDSTSLTFTQFSGAGQIIAGDAISKSGNTLNVNDDNITLEVNSDNLRIKGIAATAVGDLLIGQAGNAGYTRLVKPSGNATAHDYILSMNTSGSAQWSNTIDGGTF